MMRFPVNMMQLCICHTRLRQKKQADNDGTQHIFCAVDSLRELRRLNQRHARRAAHSSRVESDGL